MRPEDVLLSPRGGGSSAPVPIDVVLEALDRELEAAGVRARLTLNGQRQPTRFFWLELRREILDAFAGEDEQISRR